MKRRLQVHPGAMEVFADRVVVSAEVSLPLRWKRRRVFFEFPSELYDALAIRGRDDDIHDSLLRALVFVGMAENADVVVHGRVSQSLLANLEIWQEIIHSWWPKYSRVQMSADEECADRKFQSACPTPEAVLAFSGGLDSIYSLYTHQQRLVGRNSHRIGACVFVHGFDIPWQDTETFERAQTRAEVITSELGTTLWGVRTNVKDLLPNWLQSHATGIAAVLGLLERRWSTGIIASSCSYTTHTAVISGVGSTPLTDPLLSSDRFRVLHDVAVSARIDKTVALKDVDVVWPSLRVCWQGEDLSTNCGRCSKCLRQLLCMRAAGVTDQSGFAESLSVANLQPNVIESPVTLAAWQECYDHAKSEGRHRSDMFRAMKAAIDHYAATQASSDEPVPSRGGVLSSWFGRRRAA